MSRLWTALTSVLTLWGAVRGVGKQCPDLAANPSCHCYNFENGMYLECPAATVHTLKTLLEVIQSPVQSLSIYEPDKTLTKLPKNLFSHSAIIRKIHISQSNIEDLHEDSLLPLKPYLESFSLVSGRLKEIPQDAFKGLNRLNALDLQDNQITAIPAYTFYGLSLEKLSLKRNRLQN
uniref:LRRNT domain-containing protein n=1 Tax=Dendroctonus ponderosae TaxID=77166 RepID=A0AAR5QKI5_DENPD